MTKWILIIWALNVGAPNDFEVVGSFSIEDNCTVALEHWMKSNGGKPGPEGYCLKVTDMESAYDESKQIR